MSKLFYPIFKICLKIFISLLIYIIICNVLSSINKHKFYSATNISYIQNKELEEINNSNLDYKKYLKPNTSHPNNNKERNIIKILSYEVFTKDSYEFETFITEYPYNNVVFKDEELWTSRYNKNKFIKKNKTLDDYTDHYMSPTLVEKVNELAKKIKTLNPRLILRITDAFDNNLEHRLSGYHSLHYTGRAVDLTLYDTYLNKIRSDLLPLLFDLCAKTPFEYVYYHKNSHIHVSASPEKIYNISMSIRNNEANDNSINEIFLKMQIGKNGWYFIDKHLEKGIYFIYFFTNKYKYGFRNINYLGRSDNVNSYFNYYNDPIIIEIKKTSNFRFLFNPYFLKYIISGKGTYKSINQDFLNIISYFLYPCYCK